ncbi:MAG: IS3 family transposase [Vicinamibacterales bacterium]
MRLCRVFGVTREGFYASQTRPESQHERDDRTLRREVRTIFVESRGAYGSPRIYKALRARGFAVSHRRVERLMREEGLRARVVRVYRARPARVAGLRNIRIASRSAARRAAIGSGSAI